MYNKGFRLIMLLLAGCMVLSSCKKDKEVETPVPEIMDIEFFNPNPFVIDLNGYRPNMSGKITSDVALKSYSVYKVTTTAETAILTDVALNNVYEYAFDIEIPYTSTTQNIRLEVTNANDEIQTAELDIEASYASSIEPEEIGSKDAFTGAEGFGRYTTGGRGGKVLIVDNLSDESSVQGSFRWAVNQSGTRTIVFKVSGTIELKSTLRVSNSNLTIAGQTAPGDGICLAGDGIILNEGLENIIIRYIRIRPAKGSGEFDAAWGRNCKNIIIDHCTFSWANDEVASFYDNTNFTMQWCMITESFYHSTHPKGDHGYGGIWGGMGATFHHNLLAHHTSRNPRFCGARYHLDTPETEIVDFRNNVIYNWGYNSAYGGEQGQQNMVNNYYKSGPATSSHKDRIVEISSADSKWYVDGNYVEGYPDITADNWSGGVQGSSSSTNVKATTPFDFGEIVTTTAEQAFTDVLQSAGTSLVRDNVDTRIVSEVQNGTATYGGTYGANTGIIDSEDDNEGYPTLNQYNEITDYDYDGMDDDWETANGLDPKDSGDHSAYTLDDNYTNLEVYMNSLLGL